MTKAKRRRAKIQGARYARRTNWRERTLAHARRYVATYPDAVINPALLSFRFYRMVSDLLAKTQARNP